MKINVAEIGYKDFNSLFGTKLKKGMSFGEVVKDFEYSNITGFLLSPSLEEIKSRIANKTELAERSEIEIIFIKNLGIFVSPY